MRTLPMAISLAISMASNLPHAAPAGAFPQLLPPAGDFELTLREDPSTALPLGPSCTGEASVTLACRGFIVTLKNASSHTVRLSRISCQEPVVTFETKELNSSTGWWPISQVSRDPHCAPWTYENLRLRPGESTEYKTRLVSVNRPPDFAPVSPGTYTMRAQWMLWGCTENPEGADCLSPLLVMKGNTWGVQPTGDVENQTPVEVISKEIDVTSPTLPDLGQVKIAVEASLVPKEASEDARKRIGARCAGENAASIDCTVFRLTFRNVGERPVRLGRFGCSDSSIQPELRSAGGEWAPLPIGQIPWSCTANIFFETPILPGKSMDRDFLLGNIAPGYDPSGLYPEGDYTLRFHFITDPQDAHFCFASSDGSFSLQCPAEKLDLLTNEVTVHASAYTRVPDDKSTR